MVLIGGVPVTGIIGVGYGDSQECEQIWCGALPAGACQGAHHPKRETDIIPGRGAGTVGSEPRRGDCDTCRRSNMIVRYIPGSGITVTD